MNSKGIRIWGQPDPKAVAQMERCVQVDGVVGGALMADQHEGYSAPIGSVLVLEEGLVSPAWVGYDIACGILAVQTNIDYTDIADELQTIGDTLYQKVLAFGIGRKNSTRVEHTLFDADAWEEIPVLRDVKEKAREQLGTIGGGNHFVDILTDSDGKIWVMAHFGSRGFGHTVATHYIKESYEIPELSIGNDKMYEPLWVNELLGAEYMEASRLAGQYAYAGRAWVVNSVLKLLGAETTMVVHNHHNFGWTEKHDGFNRMVIRKGATPLYPELPSIVGGSMGDISAVIYAKENSDDYHWSYRSAMHGSGRVMSRTEAAGKVNYKSKARERMGGKITPEQMRAEMERVGVMVWGGGTDESPFVYRKLQTVLDAHKDSVGVQFKLKPVCVFMAPANENDPYKD